MTSHHCIQSALLIFDNFLELSSQIFKFALERGWGGRLCKQKCSQVRFQSQTRYSEYSTEQTCFLGL